MKYLIGLGFLLCLCVYVSETNAAEIEVRRRSDNKLMAADSGPDVSIVSLRMKMLRANNGIDITDPAYDIITIDRAAIEAAKKAEVDASLITKRNQILDLMMRDYIKRNDLDLSKL